MCEQRCKPLELVNTYVFGPSQVPVIGVSRYFSTVIDDYSIMVWICFTQNKSDVFSKLVEYKKMVEIKCDRKISVLWSDGGSEYMYIEFDKYLKTNGIIRQVTPQMIEWQKYKIETF